ncbi:MAG: glycosyltransferase family 2 protein [bacterium]|nr:glycosyltransferase family 2 protein [bacterium]
MKLISIVTPCYNEEENIHALYEKVKEIVSVYKKKYTFEHIFIDNCSTDRTTGILKAICKKDKNVKLIVNSKNFGFIRSQYHGLLQGKGRAVILLAADFQDPPELITDFIKKWEEGYTIVTGIKNKSNENMLMYCIRKVYYFIINKISETEQLKNFTGFGLYDKKIIEILAGFNDSYPYLRGTISEIGFKRADIPFTQPKREKGKSKFSFYSLYDVAMAGFVNHSKVPLRMAVILGFVTALLCIVAAVLYLVYAVLHRDSFKTGIAPLVMAILFIASLQFIFIGLLGEYISALFTEVKNRPHVIESERINF